MKAHIRMALCCCSAFLPKETQDEELDASPSERNKKEAKDYYKRLDISRDATYEDIRRAYKRKSLSVHPDKLAQRGISADSVDPEEFQQLKEAYEVLSEPTKRELYDAVGAEAMQYIMDPSSLDPMDVVQNLNTSTTCDKMKLVFLLLLFYVLIFLQPILICLRADAGNTENSLPWRIVLTPYWIFSIVQFFGLFFRYHLSKTKHQPSEVQFYKFISILKSLCILLTVIFLSLKLDGQINWSYTLVLSPIFAYEAVQLVKAIIMLTKATQDIDRMITLTQLEREVLDGGRTYADLTPEEKEEVNERFILVHPPPSSEEAANEMNDYDVENTPEYAVAQVKQTKALNILFTIVVHSIFLGLLIPKIDRIRDEWNWWLVFTPIWIGAFLLFAESMHTLCSSNTQVVVVKPSKDAEPDVESGSRQGDFNTQHKNYMKDDNTSTVGYDDFHDTVSHFSNHSDHHSKKNYDKTTHEDENSYKSSTSYRSNSSYKSNHSSSDKKKHPSSVPEEPERETFQDDGDGEFVYQEFGYADMDDGMNKDLKTEAFSTCCPLLFVIMITCLFVGYLQGGDDSYSSFWILFPFLFLAAIAYCCCCCIIFCTPDAATLNALNPDSEKPAADPNELDPEIKPTLNTMSESDDLEQGIGNRTKVIDSPNGFETSDIYDLD